MDASDKYLAAQKKVMDAIEALKDAERALTSHPYPRDVDHVFERSEDIRMELENIADDIGFMAVDAQ